MTEAEEDRMYREKIAAQVQQQRAEIEKLKATLAEKRADAKIGYRENLQKLEARQAELEDRFEKLKDASGDAWKEMKTGFIKAWEDVSESMKEAKEKF